jgi:hypothetical protein
LYVIFVIFTVAITPIGLEVTAVFYSSLLDVHVSVALCVIEGAVSKRRLL